MLTILALIAAAAISQNPIPLPEMTTYTSKLGGFSVKLPGPPKEETKTLKTPTGTREVISLSFSEGHATYRVARTPTTADAAAGLDVFFLGFRGALMKEAQGNMHSEKAVTLGDLPGREFDYSGLVPNGGGARGRNVVRAFLDSGKALYTVQIGLPDLELGLKGKQYLVDFLDSFQLLDRAAQAKDSAPPPVPENAEASWRLFTSKVGDFAVMLPAKPVEGSQVADQPTEPTEVLTTACNAEGATYVVVRTRLPESVPRAAYATFLEASRDGVIDEVKGKLLAERDAPLGTFPGREISYQAPLPGRPGLGTYRTRIVVVRQYLYMLTMNAPKGKLSVKDAKKFLDSFAILSARPPRGGTATPKNGARSKMSR